MQKINRGSAKKYIHNPPEESISADILSMSEKDLLDVDYFLNNDKLYDNLGKEGFILGGNIV